jgi:hypothetical protein
MGALGVSVATAVVVLLATSGRVFFLPLLVIPFGFLTFGGRRRLRRRRY